MALDDEDILTGEGSLGFDEERVPSNRRFFAVIEFLRARFHTYHANLPDSDDRNFMCVDIDLPYEQSVQLYFKKKDLYLVGWTIDNEPAKYLGVGLADTPRPGQPVTRINTDQVIDIRYGDLVQRVPLSRKQMQDSLQRLYDCLKHQKDGHPQKSGNLQTDFDVVVRMTSEMARFGGYYDSFKHSWAFTWSQSNPRTMGTNKLGCFNAVVAKWDKFSRKANNGTDTLKWPGTPDDVTVEQARAAIGDGVKLGENIT
ncbi:hypothetical protein GCM10022224_026100 [Nonomuraea antimicrobica]|uniref:Uncharacterized protein n=1 Tax=Nonomuraea antimicrobica TaxID=561173 RepID=A0ABP7BJQ5_9ACTN